jgi:molybdopterin-guanine dinucleotide biosynthesis protein A
VRLLGAVLAGGESRRYGTDKAAAVVAGRTLVDRAAQTLEAVFPEVVVVSSRAPATEGWRHVADARPGEGPLAAIEAALRHASERALEGAFVLACDLPLMDAAGVRTVIGALGTREAAAAGRAGPPGFEPLCAVYRVGCLPWVSAALDRGERAAHALFDAVDGVTASLPERQLLNVNTPADRARAAEVLEGATGVPDGLPNRGGPAHVSPLNPPPTSHR